MNDFLDEVIAHVQGKTVRPGETVAHPNVPWKGVFLNYYGNNAVVIRDDGSIFLIPREEIYIVHEAFIYAKILSAKKAKGSL